MLDEGQDSTTNHHVFSRCSFGQSTGMLIFFPWNLYKFYCKGLTCPSLNMFEIFLHPFPLGFIFPVDVPDDNLGIAMKDDC